MTELYQGSMYLIVFNEDIIKWLMTDKIYFNFINEFY